MNSVLGIVLICTLRKRNVADLLIFSYFCINNLFILNKTHSLVTEILYGPWLHILDVFLFAENTCKVSKLPIPISKDHQKCVQVQIIMQY